MVLDKIQFFGNLIRSRKGGKRLIQLEKRGYLARALAGLANNLLLALSKIQNAVRRGVPGTSQNAGRNEHLGYVSPGLLIPPPSSGYPNGHLAKILRTTRRYFPSYINSLPTWILARREDKRL